MDRKFIVSSAIFFAFVIFLTVGQQAIGQIPNQLAQDFVAGKVPIAEDVARYEKESAANPNDLDATRNGNVDDAGPHQRGREVRRLL